MFPRQQGAEDLVRNHPHQPLHRERVVSDLSHTLPLAQVGHDPRSPEKQALVRQNPGLDKRGRTLLDGATVRNGTVPSTSAGTRVLPLAVGSVRRHELWASQITLSCLIWRIWTRKRGTLFSAYTITKSRHFAGNMQIWIFHQPLSSRVVNHLQPSCGSSSGTAPSVRGPGTRNNKRNTVLGREVAEIGEENLSLAQKHQPLRAQPSNVALWEKTPRARNQRPPSP